MNSRASSSGSSSSSYSLFTCARRVIISRPAAKFRRRQILCVLLFLVLAMFAAALVIRLKTLWLGRKNAREVSASATVLPPTGDRLSELQLCDFYNSSSISLKGPIEADTESIPLKAELEAALGPSLLPGGHFIPKHCRPKHKVALLIPYRDRRAHLKIFLRHMHPFLQRQDIEYAILVIEQTSAAPFNRALLLNVGYKESIRLQPDIDCFIFHDVDLLPLDDRIFYSCTDQPVHLSATIDAHGNKLLYDDIFGGASMLTKEMMERVNGFSNVFFGWGGEDDDMSYRVRNSGMQIARYPLDIARYTMLPHAREDKQDRTTLLESGRSRVQSDGLNSLSYTRVGLALQPLFTWIKISVNQTEIIQRQGVED